MPAQGLMGVAFASGQGVEKDMTEAAKWFRKAAEQGSAEAELTLGLCYDHGDGVMKNSEESVRWLQKAALQDNAEAQCSLGVDYTTADGVAKDLVQADKWFSLAAAKGHKVAGENLTASEALMTGPEIAAAKQQAREFKPAIGP
jgi:hypothetical protein